MEQIKCKECELEFKSLDSLRRHRSQKHGINAEQTYLDYMLNGDKPTCKCGCGEKPNFLSISKGFVDYIRGHSQRVNNNWGHNLEALMKSHETQKKMHDSGELTIWNKGLTIEDPRVRDNIDKVMSNPERGNNISKALSGKEKSEEHKQRLSVTAKERWKDPKEREKQRERKVKWIKENGINKKSKLEQFFEGLLIDLNIEYEPQYPVNGYLYDFYIHTKNVLIEVDGDWFHFNEDVHNEVTSVIQENTIRNDKIKNKIAKDNGYILIRFWEYDINNNLEDVINKLKLLLI